MTSKRDRVEVTSLADMALGRQVYVDGMPAADHETLGRHAYETYCAAVGDLLPSWDNLASDKIRQAWVVVAMSCRAGGC